jgi:hypothetical protein
MARGWESKSVQEQMESAAERRARRASQLSPEELAHQQKRDSLLLHRTRVLRDLENCTDPRYRRTLTEGLAYLEVQLAELDPKT